MKRLHTIQRVFRVFHYGAELEEQLAAGGTAGKRR